MAQDYYKILGVDKKASQDEIKSQYRKLVKMYHPDLHPNDANAAAKFKEINEANEILSDPQKRAAYDYELENPYASAGGAGGFGGFGGGAGGFGGFGDIFSDIFSHFGGGESERAGTAQQKGQDLTLEVELSFLDAAKGCTKEVNYTRREPCADCKGTGAKGGTSFKTCDKCHGTGQIQYTSGGGFFRTVSVRACPDCNGTGKKIIEKCTSCGGKGSNKKTTTLSIEIPAGADTNSYIKKRNLGDASLYGGEAGDLYIRFTVKPHKILKRKNFDLYVDLPISYKTAVVGGKVSVPGIDETVVLEIPEGTPNGKVFTIRNKGIRSRMGNGNLYVTVNIEIPTRLSVAQKQKLNDFDDTVDIKQSAKMKDYQTNINSLYGVDPYANK